MTSAEIRPAPLWRRTLSGAADAAIVWAGMWLWRRRAVGEASQARAVNPLAVPVGAVGELAREQLRSPGQRLLGLRTVDRRTGDRPELRRALGLLGLEVGGQRLARAIAPAPLTLEQERQREGFLEELNAINQRHAHDRDALEAERRQLYERHEGPAGKLWRSAGPTLAIGLLGGLLRRRLAPTTEVLVRERGPHSP